MVNPELGGSYAFTCPGCDEVICSTVEERVLVALARLLPLVEWQTPAEMTEPKEGPPLTPDDLLAFRKALNGRR